MADYYILNGHEPQPAELLEWAAWFEDTENRRVALAEWHDGGEQVAQVSTVFMGLDHDFSATWDQPGHRPLVFETMAFGGPLDQEQRCYYTWDAAMTGHRYLVGVVSAVMGEPTASEERP